MSSADDELVEVEREGPVLRLWLRREAVRNALSAALVEALVRQLRTLQPEVRVVVLGGRGSDFCAGADLAEMRSSGQAARESNLAEAEKLGALFAAIHDCPRPVVARVQGAALGGGVGLVAACDLAVAAATAKLGFTEVRLGLLPAVISPYVVRRIGDRWARELFLTGERIDGTRAAAIGLVQEAVAEPDLDAAVARKVEMLLAGSTAAQAGIKQLLARLADATLAEARALTPACIADARASADGQEGLAAFLEKRKPRWSGR